MTYWKKVVTSSIALTPKLSLCHAFMAFPFFEITKVGNSPWVMLIISFIWTFSSELFEEFIVTGTKLSINLTYLRLSLTVCPITLTTKFIRLFLRIMALRVAVEETQYLQFGKT